MLSYMELYDILGEAGYGKICTSWYSKGTIRIDFISEDLVVGESLAPSPAYFLYPKIQEVADKLTELFKSYPEVKISTPTDGIFAL